MRWKQLDIRWKQLDDMKAASLKMEAAS